jgi:hypothetical protein
MDTEKRVEITLTVTVDDMYRASLALTWKRMVRLLLLSSALAVFLFVLGRGDPSSVMNSWAAVVTIGALLLAPFYFWTNYSRASRAVKENRVYRNPLTYVFTEKGILVTGPTFRAESDWSNVSSVVETRSSSILSPSVVSITVLPKRCFPEPSALATLREIMRSHVSAKMKLQS